ncbi:MAG: DUF296 domain-containing protein [Hyphomicrobiales bacterium]|nr:DUF296 domain-containing protein [Hyphomicrobiales bacterium]
MRHILQPGPPARERHVAVVTRGVNFDAVLPQGLRLLDAVAAAFAAEGCQSGVLRFGAGMLGPMAYVMPALSATPDHAAFYSAPSRPAGLTTLQSGALTFGWRHGQPFFHCHAFWQEADGRCNGGHILPEETRLAAPLAVTATGLFDAAFEAVADEETGFILFEPRGKGVASAPFHALRLRPNQDLAGALLDYCRQHGMAGARLHGGVGSLIGAHYADGRISWPFATEMAIRAGRLSGEAAHIDIELVDFEGNLSSGVLQGGDNPVLMTMELVLEAVSQGNVT